MKRYIPYWLFWLLFIFLALVFRDSFTHFFLADDFFHIILSRGEALIGAFNIFERAFREYYIYRPLTTQLFWTVGESLFGLNPLPYHVINFAFYLVNIILAYKVGRLLLGSPRRAGLVTLVYALSGSHFYRLFFLSTIQDTVMATLVMSTLLLYAKNRKLAFVAFTLALTAKETAVTTPAMLFAYDLLINKKFAPRVISYGIISVLYFAAHKYFFGFYQGGLYTYEFGLRSTITNYLWYYFWSFGLPEDFVNVGVLSRTFFTGGQVLQTYGWFGQIIFYLFLALQSLLAVGATLWLKTRLQWRTVLFGIAVFIAFVLPVGFFPFHKFAINLAAPLLGVALVVSVIVGRIKWLTFLVILVMAILLSLTVDFNTNNHWISKRGKIARDTLTQLKERYPQGLDGQTIYVRNNFQYHCKIDPGEQKNSAEIAYSLAYRDGLDVFYPRDNFSVYFEDFDQNAHCDMSVALVDGCRIIRTVKADRDHCPKGE